MKPFKKVLIANRGEIALRIIRTLREMGIKSVAVYSEEDRQSLHVKHADEAVCIGPAPSRESYLNINALLSAAKITDACAIHPGYGFLSENAEFSRAAAEAGIVFIGPRPEAIKLLGYKSSARQLALKHNVPIVPGTKGCIDCNFKQEGEKIGYPIMVKAAAGGGGKGMRIVRTPDQIEHEVKMAQSEAQSAFGDGAVYLERYVEQPRHVEIQVAADNHGNAVAFPERDCSVQRRHQKLIEESPSPAVTPKLRHALAEAAIRMVKASGYHGVGTVEFLLDKNQEFYFMEVNTRLQVEHPVTEAVSGIDLVREQIIIAQGGTLTLTPQEALRVHGHAIEHRINAENPDLNFAPCPGTVEQWIMPGGLGVRIDSHIYTGYTIPTYYDSLIAKLIVWAPDRKTAIARSKRALTEMQITGVDTTAKFHLKILNNAEFAGGEFDTGLLERMKDKEPVAA